jgi:hypothetical protein
MPPLLINESPTKRIARVIPGLEQIAEKLLVQARPGHVAYISKQEAAEEIRELIQYLKQSE